MNHQQGTASAVNRSMARGTSAAGNGSPRNPGGGPYTLGAPSGGSYRVELKSTGQTVVANSRTQKQILENAERIIAKADAKTREGAKSPKRGRWQKLLGRRSVS